LATTAIEHAVNLASRLEILGTFGCRGKVDPKINELLLKKPEHRAWAETAKSAVSHPDESDLADARQLAKIVSTAARQDPFHRDKKCFNRYLKELTDGDHLCSGNLCIVGQKMGKDYTVRLAVGYLTKGTDEYYHGMIKPHMCIYSVVVGCFQSATFDDFVAILPLSARGWRTRGRISRRRGHPLLPLGLPAVSEAPQRRAADAIQFPTPLRRPTAPVADVVASAHVHPASRR
jgi:hypothetical protein